MRYLKPKKSHFFIKIFILSHLGLCREGWAVHPCPVTPLSSYITCLPCSKKYYFSSYYGEKHVCECCRCVHSTFIRFLWDTGFSSQFSIANILTSSWFSSSIQDVSYYLHFCHDHFLPCHFQFIILFCIISAVTNASLNIARLDESWIKEILGERIN